jgi:hypothetical protein
MTVLCLISVPKFLFKIDKCFGPGPIQKTGWFVLKLHSARRAELAETYSLHIKGRQYILGR